MDPPGHTTDEVPFVTCNHCGMGLPAPARFCSRCGFPLEPDERSAAQRLGEHLGPEFHVLGELGRGGFAVVYLVDDRSARRHLAVKVMRRELMIAPLLVERFRREIRLASRLDHPNILPVLFSVERGDFVCYAMPRVKGESLKQHLRKEPQLPVQRTLQVLHDLAAGLVHAHEHGVVHRDIKPSNVMLDRSGAALILDFGLARALAPDGGTLSISGEIIGSPQYLSPEQAAGQKDLDHRCDVYNWGILGYEMLTGQPPFSGETLHEVLHKHLTATPEHITALRSDVPTPVAAVLERALQKDREQRWQTMAEAVTALDEMLPSRVLKAMDKRGNTAGRGERR
jgi:serine/threonine-protein kinase